MTEQDILNLIRGGECWLNYYDIHDKENPDSIITEIQYIDNLPQETLSKRIKLMNLKDFTNEELLKLVIIRPDNRNIKSIQIYNANNDLLCDKKYR